jgi:hypothetical protein
MAKLDRQDVITLAIRRYLRHVLARDVEGVLHLASVDGISRGARVSELEASGVVPLRSLEPPRVAAPDAPAVPEMAEPEPAGNGHDGNPTPAGLDRPGGEMAEP